MKKNTVISGTMFLLYMIAFMGCTPEDQVVSENGNLTTCEGCHTNKTVLKQIAGTGTSNGGGGG